MNLSVHAQRMPLWLAVLALILLLNGLLMDKAGFLPAAAVSLVLAIIVGVITSKKTAPPIPDEQRQSVLALTAERDRLCAVLLAMDDAIVVFDEHGDITFANDAASVLLGDDHPLVGRSLASIGDDPALAQWVGKGLLGESTSAVLTLHSAQEREMQTSVTPLPSGDAMLMMHDVTELRRLETVRRDFVENVSHELRTPVSVVRINAETLLDGGLDDHDYARRFVERIHRSAERLSYLVTDLLDLSRIEAGRHATKMNRVPVRHAVDLVMADVSVHAAERNLTITVDVPEHIVVQADATGLEQILQNLLENAVRYTPEGGEITVRAITSSAHNNVRIEVSDNGPGIAPQHRERIFERFYRVDAGRSRAVGGTGLGLAIVRHLSELMGGNVGVEESEAGGCLFWVTLAMEQERDA